MRPRLNVVTPGQRFGRLTVIREVLPPGPPGKPRWMAVCRCDCGGEPTVYVRHLCHGSTLSCGCLGRERAAAVSRTHGLRGHPLYGAWKTMMARCYNPGDKRYSRYGGRGIRVCDRWHDVRLFVADIERWLGPRPPRMTLDRICNDHDYRLDNVRWATYSEQNRNQRRRPRMSDEEMRARRRHLYRERKGSRA